MYDVRLGLELVVDALYDAPFSPQSIHKKDALVKEVLEKRLLDVPPAGEYLAIEILGETRPYPFVHVIHVCA